MLPLNMCLLWNRLFFLALLRFTRSPWALQQINWHSLPHFWNLESIFYDFNWACFVLLGERHLSQVNVTLSTYAAAQSVRVDRVLEVVSGVSVVDAPAGTHPLPGKLLPLLMIDTCSWNDGLLDIVKRLVDVGFFVIWVSAPRLGVATTDTSVVS